MNRSEGSWIRDVTCLVIGAALLLGFVFLAVRLWLFQVSDTADWNLIKNRQSMYRVQTPGIRGSIYDRNGVMLAGNRSTVTIVCDVARFRGINWETTATNACEAIASLAAVIGAEMPVDFRTVREHVSRNRTLPLELWRDVDHQRLARFLERADEYPDFRCLSDAERIYPCGATAAHIIGYTGYSAETAGANDIEAIRRCLPEMRGRAGVEARYDEYLRGVPGEKTILVDALLLPVSESTVIEPRSGPDLRLTIDVRIQRAVERQLEGCRGGCVALDPRDGAVLALASSPGFDPNRLVPVFEAKLYRQLVNDPEMPLFNRAVSGLYAPGSTFKPITALAGIVAGVPPAAKYECTGVFEYHGLSLHCSRRWGHGGVDMVEALKKSCNPYFCNLGFDIGTNCLMRTARTFGLGARTGIDLAGESSGLVPSGEWKRRRRGERWLPGDLIQMSIGQGDLLVTPLQMARVAGAIGTGKLVRPHLNSAIKPEVEALPFSTNQLGVVRRGMWEVVNALSEWGSHDGTGWRGGVDVPVGVCGKTGTAEVGRGANRRKNTWFIAYAPTNAPTVAVAMVIENGESGGETTAPKVAAVLRECFR